LPGDRAMQQRFEIYYQDGSHNNYKVVLLLKGIIFINAKRTTDYNHNHLRQALLAFRYFFLN